MSSSQVYVNFQFLRESSIPIKYKRIRSKFLRGTKHPQFKVHTKTHNHTLNTHMNIFSSCHSLQSKIGRELCEVYICSKSKNRNICFEQIPLYSFFQSSLLNYSSFLVFFISDFLVSDLHDSSLWKLFLLSFVYLPSLFRLISIFTKLIVL